MVIKIKLEIRKNGHGQLNTDAIIEGRRRTVNTSSTYQVI